MLQKNLKNLGYYSMKSRVLDQEILKLINKIHVIDTEENLDLFLKSLINRKTNQPVSIAFINAHALNMCYKNPDFRDNLINCDYVLRDGIGIKILFKMLGKNPGLNLNGTDLIPHILTLSTGKTISLYGTETKYLEIASNEITSIGVKVVDINDGFQPDDTYIQSANKFNADIILLAMGMPKQERVAKRLSEVLETNTIILCGGAVLDFMAGKVTRAPEFLRKFGLEWLYRLVLEPRRLFKRYLIGNVVMLWHAFNLATHKK